MIEVKSWNGEYERVVYGVWRRKGHVTVRGAALRNKKADNRSVERQAAIQKEIDEMQRTG